ncbi:MAG: hypothetical protein IPK59_00235 [Rhodospirillaceae bacterium]|nr:hypothetical protein [Rhodospirillaceae bacterium]
MSNPLKDKLAHGGCITCHWATLGSPSVAELLAGSGRTASSSTCNMGCGIA